MRLALAQSIRAETLKLRRTYALWLTLGAPLAVAILFILLVLAFNPEGSWVVNIVVAVNFWSILMLPLYVTLLTALINGIDHKARAWKHLYTLPVPRWNNHVSNLGASLILVFFSSLILAGSLLLDIALLKTFGFGPDGGGGLPYGPVFEKAFQAYGGALSALAIQHWLSLRKHSFTWPLGIGIVATFFATQVSQSPYWFFLPWGYPVVATSASDMDMRSWALIVSVVSALVIAILAGWDSNRRDITE